MRDRSILDRVCIANVSIEAEYALGHHIWTLDPEDFVVYGKVGT